MNAIIRFSLTAAGIALLSIPNFAQKASVEQMGAFAGKDGMATIHMQCKLGSIKSIDGQGRMEISFKGTFLITDYKGEAPIFKGNIKKEYEQGGRVCYTGQGTCILNGSWRGVQWLGSDMSAVWYGKGVCRVSGEFWKNPVTGELESGRYWYEKPEGWQPFTTQGVMNIFVPEPVYGADKEAKPKVRGGGGS